jgi:hypothetical protein
VAAITSSRSPCHAQASASPAADMGNQAECGTIQTFRVTVRVVTA